MKILEVRTENLAAAQIAAIRELLWAAFSADHEDGGMTEDDWQHALGGTHFVLEEDARIVGHASVVERELHVGDRPLRTGYVEAVAVDPARQGSGLGTKLMQAVTAHIDAAFELGCLGTGNQAFYERLGWEVWQGPTLVRTSAGLERSADEDGYILVLRTRSSPPLDLTDAISCDWRQGDSW
jgi:aminoglycoside 2'-N-acetyltransferase I